MKSFVLFVATFAVVYCADIRERNTADTLQIITSLFCSSEQKIDISSIKTKNEEVMRIFQDKSLQEIQGLYCVEESITTVATEVTNTDANVNIIQSTSIQPNVEVVPDITLDNTASKVTPVPTEVINTDISTSIIQHHSMEVTGITTDYDTSLEIIEFPCPTPLLDPINCNLMCFIKKKLEFKKCIEYYFGQHIDNY